MEKALLSVKSAEQTYAFAIGELEAMLAGQRSGLSPRTVLAIEQGLGEIERVVERCRQVLRSDPSSLEAHRVLLAAYQQKVDLLSEVLTRVEHPR